MRKRILVLAASLVASIGIFGFGVPAGAHHIGIPPCDGAGGWTCYYSANSNSGVWHETGWNTRQDNQVLINYCLNAGSYLQLRYMYPDGSTHVSDPIFGCHGLNLGFGASYAKAGCRIIGQFSFIRCEWR